MLNCYFTDLQPDNSLTVNITKETKIIIMKKFKLSIFLILISTVLSFAQHADGLIGTYRLPNKLDIKIFSSNGKYYGKIVALNGFENGQTIDINNPDKSKRKNSLIGMTIIKGLKYDKKERQWLNGNMYGPEKGMKHP